MNRRILPALLLGAVTTLGLLAGCSSPNTPPTSTPTSGGSSPSTSSGGSGDSAPKVRHPLNASAFTSKPCTALTSSDVASLGLSGAQPQDNSIKIAPGCAWGVGDKTVAVKWETIDTHGLSDLYAQKSSMAYWIPGTISGYPAVEADSSDSRSTIGSCTVQVGVNDQLFFFVDGDAGAGNGSQACSLAKQAAGMVIKNLQAAQGG